MIYLIGSLRNPKVQILANTLRDAGFDVFDDWASPGAEADEKWQEYERARGRTYREALYSAHAMNVFEFDKRHLDAANVVVLCAPAGKSAHLELGYAVGRGKLTFIYMEDEPERFDIMPLFANDVLTTLESLVDALTRAGEKNEPRAS